jgi:NADH dehydrogenase [ubiquinone] 1 alpha subcomplex assembly factor 7
VSEEVAERVRAAIVERGPIGFDEYMGLALYGPGGFFERPPVGPRGHFVTSPHVHPFVFAHCVRDAIVDAWFALGEIDPLPLVELGAGDGTLANALVQAFEELPTPKPAYTGVEVSEGAREALAAAGYQTASTVAELGPFEGVAFANELLDNLPFLLARGGPGGPTEVRVGLEGARLVEVEAPWPKEIAAPSLEPGQTTTVPVGAFAMLDEVARVMQRGYLLAVDYGTRDGPAGGVRGFREHRQVADVLSDPGSADITAGVDLSAIAAHARSLGLRSFEPVTQAAALAALGHDRWERTMREMQSMLERTGRGSQAVRVWEARSRASLLADPSGFGGFWWLVLATEGLPEPPWLGRARSSD